MIFGLLAFIEKTTRDIQVACDPRELERALTSQRGVAYRFRDSVAERAMIRADPNGDAAFLAKSDKRRETLANPAAPQRIARPYIHG